MKKYMSRNLQRQTFNHITLLPRLNWQGNLVTDRFFNITMTAFRWCQCRHEFLCLPVDLSERSQLALGPISVQAGRKKIWSSIMTTLRLGNNGDLRWRESSTQLLDAFCHSSDFSGPMGIGTQGGGREGWGLDPALQGQPLPQGHMGKHLAALSLFHISLYLCLRIFLCPIFFHEPPTQGCCSHCTWNIVHMTVCVCVYKWV